MPYTDSFQKTISALLEKTHGKTLTAYIEEEREIGASYEQIARRLAKETGGAVHVTGKAVRDWHQQGVAA